MSRFGYSAQELRFFLELPSDEREALAERYAEPAVEDRGSEDTAQVVATPFRAARRRAGARTST